MSDIKPLTAKQQAFVEAYTDIVNKVTFGNATQSAIQAGYNPKWAQTNTNQITKNNYVKTAIIDITAKRQAKAGYNQEKAHEELNNLIERCKTAGDRTVEAACLREMNTIYALRTEKVITGSLEQAEALNVKQKEEAQAIATIRLAEITVHKVE